MRSRSSEYAGRRTWDQPSRGSQLIVRLVVAEWEIDPFRPVTVSVEVPAEARFALTVIVEVQPELARADEGENDALTRLGRPLTLSETEPEKPLSGVTVTV